MLDPQLVTQIAISGILAGVVYGSIGLAFVTVFRVTSVINFTQADLGLVGAFVAISLSRTSIALGLLGAVAASAAVSAVVYLLVLHPLRHASLLVKTIALLGAGIVLGALLHLVYGTNPQILRPFNDGPPLLLAGAAFPLQGFWIIGWGIALVVGLHAFFERTLLGRAVQACAIDRYAASLSGIPVQLMSFAAFVIAGIISGVAVTVQAPLSYVTVTSSLALALKGFIASVLGGGERIGATMLAGIMLGMLESFVVLWLPIAFQQIFVLAALLAILMLRPSGLGRASARGV